jgi:hypothetical protein
MRIRGLQEKREDTPAAGMEQRRAGGESENEKWKSENRSEKDESQRIESGVISDGTRGSGGADSGNRDLVLRNSEKLYC